MDNDRIGGLGVNVIDNYLLNAGFMKADIRHHDNIPIWDGDIYVYATEDDLNNNNFKYRVPVQVKSHFYEVGEFPETTQYGIKVSNLHNYLAEGGVIFFNVYVRKNESQIYVNYLTRKKIKQLLNGKEHQTTIQVNFPQLPDDEQLFIRELDTFNYQRRYTTKSLTDFNPENTLEVILDVEKYGLNPENTEKNMQYLATHYIDVLFREEGSEELFYPEEGRVCLGNVQKFFGITYYGSFPQMSYFNRVCASDGYWYIIEDGWLKFHRSFDSMNSTILLNFKCTTFRETVRKFKIINGLLRTDQITLGNDTLLLVPFETNANFEVVRNVIDFWLKFDELCQTLHVYHDFNISGLKDSDIEKIKMLYHAYVKKNEVDSSLQKDHLSLTVIGELRIVSWVKLTHGNKARIFNIDEHMTVAYRNPSHPGQRLLATTFTALFSYEDIPSNIQLDNICAAYSQAKLRNPYIIEQANLDLLLLIKHFDRTQRPELLTAAIKFAHWIIENCEEDERHIHRINALQLIAREGKKISDSDKDWLVSRSEDTGNKLEKLCCVILLKERDRAQHIFKNLTGEDKETFPYWPMYKLYQDLTNTTK